MAPESEHGWKHWLRPGIGPPKSEIGNDGKPIENPDKDAVPFEYPDEEASLPAPGMKDAGSEVMVLLQVRKEGYDDATIQDACRGMLDALETASAAATPPINLKVCLVQFHDGRSNAVDVSDVSQILNLKTNAPSEKAMDVIHESMCGLRFSLSAQAFFQVNTVAAEALYRLAGEWASPSGKSLLLDVCCGTGTIGLTLAKDVAKVVGVDIVEESIKDAFVNAQLNGVSNTDWVAGKAEVAIPRILNQYKSLIKPNDGAKSAISKVAALDDPDMSADEDTEAALQHQRTVLDQTGVEYLYDDVVAIVDPPRAGLHRQVLIALRRENRLKRLVYVSCNAKTMAENVIDLCLPQGQDGNGGGVPFTPVKALALDLFPHTEHVEAIMLLER
jgi:tRNA (uracil-5-)-methyltransferase